MLDFKTKTYLDILKLAIKHNVIANCREYPSLFLNRRRIKFAKIQKNLRKKFNDPSFNCGLYVHFPFCASRCSFCKYYSELFKNKSIFDQYLESIKKELALYKVNFHQKELCNLFLGGGTPTLLDGKKMASYLEVIHDFFKFKKNSQFTIEGTPESLNKAKLRDYKKMGINRISIGLQSSNNEVLKMIGRRHTVEDVFKAFAMVRKSGIKYIGTEVIWGLPGESLKSYQKTVKDLIKLSPDFIEGYLLTTGGRVKVDRFYPPDIELDEAINMFKEKLLANNYRIYYSSNFLGFIKKGVSKSKAMNQNTDGLYGYYSDVLGIGAGASSHFSNLKYKIISDSQVYKNYLRRNNPSFFYGMGISQEDYKRHYIILQIGFFRSINKKRYKELFGNDFSEDFPEEIEYLKRKKIIREFPLLYKWQLGGRDLGHKSFFMHVIQFWYSPKYIRQIIRKYL